MKLVVWFMAFAFSLLVLCPNESVAQSNMEILVPLNLGFGAAISPLDTSSKGVVEIGWFPSYRGNPYHAVVLPLARTTFAFLQFSRQNFVHGFIMKNGVRGPLNLSTAVWSQEDFPSGGRRQVISLEFEFEGRKYQLEKAALTNMNADNLKAFTGASNIIVYRADHPRASEILRENQVVSSKSSSGR